MKSPFERIVQWLFVIIIGLMTLYAVTWLHYRLTGIEVQLEEIKVYIILMHER